MNNFYGQGLMYRLLNKSLAGLLCVSLLTPVQAIADSPANSAESQQPIVRDVELAEGGIARGIVVTSEGQFAAGVEVALHSNGEVFQATADEHGQFAIGGLNGGDCIIQVGQIPYGARMWAHGTAPPQALQQFVVVEDEGPVVRGGSPTLPHLTWPKGTGHLFSLHGLSQKQLIALGIGAAAIGATIAIILAIEDDGDASN